MLTVKELIEQLAELPPDLEVLVAQVPDDTFRPFTEVTVGFAVKENEHHDYYGYCQEEYYEVDSETGESEYPGDNAVVLWPHRMIHAIIKRKGSNRPKDRKLIEYNDDYIT